MSKRPDTPNISSDLIDEESQKLFNESVKECIEVLEGKRGDGLDRALTARDLSDAGVIKVTTSASDVSGEIGIVVPALVTDVVEFPTGPTGLVVSGAFTNILLVWDQPTFSGFTSTEVWRYDTNLLASSVLVATVEHHMYSEPVDPGSTYYYWIRHVNSLNQKSSFNASSGTLGQTNRTVASILTDLNESIGISSLDAALSADISTIGTIGTSVTQHTSALGAISGEQYVRINGAGEVAGYGIAAGPTSSEFVVNAGLFKVGNGTESSPPFFIVTGAGMAFGLDGTRYSNQTQSWQQNNADANIAGGKWFAAGTYMETAMIADASIDTAKINNLTVDFANVTGVLTASQIEAIQINAANIDIDNYLDFTSTTSGVRFQKTTLADVQAGAFYGRQGSVAGFRVGGPTGGIYADSTGLVQLNNVRLYSGGPGTPVAFTQVGTVLTQGISSTGTVTILVVGGGAGAPNNGLSLSNGYYYPANESPGTAGTASWLEFRNAAGTRVGSRYTAAGGAIQGITHLPNNYYANGVAGQASSQPNSAGAGGTPSPTNGYRGGGGGSPGGGFQNGSNTAAVTTSANAGTTISQQVTVPTGATQIAVYLGAGGAGGYFYYAGSPNGNQAAVTSVAGGNGGSGYVTYADPQSGGIEIDLTSILTRLNALEGA
jgi:hypothetical protein